MRTLAVLILSLLTLVSPVKGEAGILGFSYQTQTVGGMFAAEISEDWHFYTDFKAAFALFESRRDGIPEYRTSSISRYMIIGLGVMKSFRTESRDFFVGLGAGEATRYTLTRAQDFGFIETRARSKEINGSLYLGAQEKSGFLWGLAYDTAPNSIGGFIGVSW